MAKACSPFSVITFNVNRLTPPQNKTNNNKTTNLTGKMELKT